MVFLKESLFYRLIIDCMFAVDSLSIQPTPGARTSVEQKLVSLQFKDKLVTHKLNRKIKYIQQNESLNNEYQSWKSLSINQLCD